MFLPSAQAANKLDREMRDRLCASLDHIAQQLEAASVGNPNRLIESVPLVRERAVSPLVFAHYYDIVLAIKSKDFSALDKLLDDFQLEANRPAELSVLDLSEEDLGEHWRSYAEKLDIDPKIPLNFLPPLTDRSASMRKKLEISFGLMEHAVPELCEEIKVFIKQILLARGPEGDDAEVFEGISSFMVWGAILLNCETHESVVQVAQAVVHESAHHVLFGYSIDEPLVFDDPANLYSSPLRDDARPMDGIYHATFVLARMSYLLDNLLAKSVLIPEQIDEASMLLELHIERFYEGFQVIETHAQLSEIGQELLAATKLYMDGLAQSRAKQVTH